MRVLVTGASGFLGSRVCDALLARGDEVVGLTRDPDRARETNPTVTWHAWRPAAERPPTESLAGVGGVVNLVGEPIDASQAIPAHYPPLGVPPALLDGLGPEDATAELLRLLYPLYRPA